MNKVNEVTNSKKNSFGNILYANFFCMDCGEAFSSPFFHFVINLAKCPECGNLIELDWNGNPDDEKDKGCGGNCSGCSGCK